MTTIQDLLRAQANGTVRQLNILAKADRLFRDRCGRYYGGALTDEEIDQLDPEYLARQASNQS